MQQFSWSEFYKTKNYLPIMKMKRQFFIIILLNNDIISLRYMKQKPFTKFNVNVKVIL